MGIWMPLPALLLFLTGLVDALRGHQDLAAEQKSSISSGLPFFKCRTSKCSDKKVSVKGDLAEEVSLTNCRVTETFIVRGEENEESTMCEETCNVTLNPAQKAKEVRVQRKSGKGAQDCQLRKEYWHNEGLCQEACCAAKCNERSFELKKVKPGIHYFNGCKVKPLGVGFRSWSGSRYHGSMPCAETCQVKDWKEVTVLRESQVPNPSCEMSVDDYPLEEIGILFIEQIETTALKLVVDRKEEHLPLLKGDTVKAFLEKMHEATDERENHTGKIKYKDGNFSREIAAEHVVMIGDLYGQLFTLIAFLNKIKEHYADKGFKTLDESSLLFCDPSIQYVFLGNYVNRGESGVEVLLLLLAYKARCPQSVILLQGSEEGQTWWGPVFLKELKYKGHRNKAYDLKSLVQTLPYVAVAPGKFMAMHGGITPTFETKCRNNTRRFEDCLNKNIAWETFFAEPFGGRGWKKPHSVEGIGWLVDGERTTINFGMDIAAGFLKSNGLSKIFRGHEFQYSGFEELKEGEYSVITLPSATDPLISYCPSNSPPWMANVTQIELPKSNEGAIAFIHSTDSKVTWTPVTMSALTAKAKADQITGATCDHSYHGPRSR